jgi:hypothetical protein
MEDTNNLIESVDNWGLKQLWRSWRAIDASFLSGKLTGAIHDLQNKSVQD